MATPDDQQLKHVPTPTWHTFACYCAYNSALKIQLYNLL